MSPVPQYFILKQQWIFKTKTTSIKLFNSCFKLLFEITWESQKKSKYQNEINKIFLSLNDWYTIFGWDSIPRSRGKTAISPQLYLQATRVVYFEKISYYSSWWKISKNTFFCKNKHNKSLLFCILGANEFSVNEPKRFESNDSEQPLATYPSQPSGKTLQPSSKSGLGASKVESEPPKKKRNMATSSFNDTDAGAKAGSTSSDSDIEILLETPKVDTFL